MIRCTHLNLCALLIVACTSLPVQAQTTKPSETEPAGESSAALDVRAAAAFNGGQYGVALPMLEKLAEESVGDPDRFGRIQEQIRVCQAAIAAGQPGPTTGPTPETRAPIEKPKSGETLEITIRELGNFVYDADKGGDIPADVKALNGAKLRVRGFMIPMDQADSVTQFAMVPDLFACCFGQPPQVQHTIIATLPEGKSVSYFPDELSVEGTLTVREKREDGFIISLFEMDVTSVKPSVK